MSERVAQVMDRAKAAAGIFSQYDQQQVDAIVAAAAKAGFNARVKLAKMAEISVPEKTRLLIAPQAGVGRDYPLSGEVLAPIIAWYEAADYDAAVKLCIDLNFHGGIGHTVSIFSNDRERMRPWSPAQPPTARAPSPLPDASTP